jgi:hypothetical protein
MSKVEELWEQISNLTIHEKVIIYKRIKQEVYSKQQPIYCANKDGKDEPLKY